MAPQAQAFASTWLARGNKTTFAFEVTMTAVPELSSFALAVMGMVLLLVPEVRAETRRVHKPRD